MMTMNSSEKKLTHKDLMGIFGDHLDKMPYGTLNDNKI